jgi:opine dehydrogenase
MPAHVSLFNKLAACLDYLGPTKLLINLSGVFSGIDQYLNSLNRSVFKKIKVYDTSTFPYACRAGKNNDVVVLGRKSELAIAPLFPSDDYYLEQIPIACRPSPFQQEVNTFKLGLLGTNAIFHSATVLFNARLIDSGNSFLFYKEGISKKTSLLHEALDGERIALGKAMGYELNRCVEDDNKLYGTNFSNSYDFSVNSSVHHNIKAPATLDHRFVTEDVAYGLVPLAALGKLYDVDLLNIESVINIFSTIMGIDYYQCGRHLAGLTRNIIDKRMGIIPTSVRMIA